MLIGISLTMFGCVQELQEAALAGTYDFVTNSITDTLQAIIPLADYISGS